MDVVRVSWKFAVPGGAGPDTGANAALTPPGRPVTENESVELNPPTIVSLTLALPEAPGVTVTVVGATERLKSGLTTERVRDVVRVSPPPVPVMVSVVVPSGVDDDVAIVRSAAVPPEGGGNEEAAKVPVAPAGRPETEKETAPVKPPDGVAVTVVVAEPPGPVETAAGETETEKSGLYGETTSERGAVLVSPPPMPVTVSPVVPAGVLEEVVIVRS